MAFGQETMIGSALTKVFRVDELHKDAATAVEREMDLFVCGKM